MKLEKLSLFERDCVGKLIFRVQWLGNSHILGSLTHKQKCL